MSTSVPTDQPPAHALGLDPRPLTAHVGAKIFGVDPSAPLSAEVVGEIRATLCRWKVVPPYHNQLPIARRDDLRTEPRRPRPLTRGARSGTVSGKAGVDAQR